MIDDKENYSRERGLGGACLSTKAEAASMGTRLTKPALGCGLEEASEDLAPRTSAPAT